MAEPTPERRREILRELTQEGVASGGYGYPVPERQDLHERIIEVIKSVRIHPKLDPIVTQMMLAGTGFHITDDEAAPLANAIIAELAGDAGDVPKRMAEAIKAAAYVCPGNDCQLTEAECQGEHPITLVASHRPHDGSAEVVFVEGTTVALAEAVMPVRSELGAHMAARIAVAERDLEDAKVELASTQGQLGDYRATLKRTTEQRDALKAELAETKAKAPSCNGMCLTAADVGVPVEGNPVARAHRSCPEHGDLETVAWELDAALRAEGEKVEGLQAELAEARAAIERVRADISKMRHGEDPFGGSAADSADLLDAALDASQRPEDTTAMHHADDCWISTHQTGTCNCGAERPEDIREEAG